MIFDPASEAITDSMTEPDAYQAYLAHRRAADTPDLQQEWEEFSPSDPASYRCQHCGRRWSNSDVYPDPHYHVWCCRHCRGSQWVYSPPGVPAWTNVERRQYRRGMWMRFWMFAIATWLLLALLFRALAWNGTNYTSAGERWGASLAVAFALNLLISGIAAIASATHASSVERRHGWGRSLTWPYHPGP